MSSSQFRIKRKNHLNQQNLAINKFLENSQFTDVTLIASGKCLMAHRVILASSSVYFRNFFTTNFYEVSEASKSNLKISQACIIEDVNFVDLQNIIRYIYAGELIIDRDYLNHFMEVVKFFGVAEIHDLQIDAVNPNVYEMVKEEAVNVLGQEKSVQEDKKFEVVVRDAEIDVIVPGPSKLPNILRSTTKFSKKTAKLSENKLPTKEDEKSFLEQLNLFPKDKLKARPKSTTKKAPKRLIIKLPRSSKRKNTIIPHKFECRYCSRPYQVPSSLKNHEKYCIMNNNRSISICNQCNEEVKPGSMSFHKKKYHGHVTQSRRMTIDVEMFNAIKKSNI